MQIITNTTEFRLLVPTAVAIGKFDGLHRGHRKLLKEIIEAKKKGLTSVVFTFNPPPEVLFGVRPLKDLTTMEEKRKLFAEMGVDILIEYPLNRENAAIEPEAFVREILIEQMSMEFLAAGYDVSFGKGGKGDAELLKKLAPECGFTVEIIDKLREHGREISSTYVREEVQAGHMDEVRELLGEPYSVVGEVQHGAKLGRRIGMPTVNLLPEEEKLLPPYGVYYSLTQIGGKEYRSITNIGNKPTVNSENQTGVETYIYDFDKDVYGSVAVVKLLHFKRPEKKFGSVEELKAQMMQDVAEGREYKG